MIGHLVWALALSTVHLRGRRRVVDAARARHEVRGPLSVAQIALDGLERSARVEAIGLELRRAALALDDLAGRRDREAADVVDVGALLREGAPSWHALAVDRGVALELFACPASVVGDPLRLLQACGNLVANAIEHGGGHVRVVVSAAAGRVTIEVADRGPGLPTDLPALVAAARGRRSARGHGLAIADAIAARYGGRLVSAPSPRGARLIVDLPEADPGRPQVVARGRRPRSGRPRLGARGRRLRSMRPFESSS